MGIRDTILYASPTKELDGMNAKEFKNLLLDMRNSLPKHLKEEKVKLIVGRSGKEGYVKYCRNKGFSMEEINRSITDNGNGIYSMSPI